MLTTKVVSNKKPPLLSDSESGGSTSLAKKWTEHDKFFMNYIWKAFIDQLKKEKEHNEE